MSAVAVPSPSPALAPWLQRQLDALLAQQGHAWLLHGPSGLGQYGLALALASAWLCEAPRSDGSACGACSSCHCIAVRSHPDLRVLMPETEMLRLQWPLGEKAQAEIDDKKRKPSREIRVDALRDAIDFAQRTASRAQGKAVLVYPAEAMNGISANALLKTLEEPVGNTRFILATEAAHLLLPTIRSRCMAHALQFPSEQEGQEWLVQQAGLDPGAADTWWMASGGRPDDALELQALGLTPQQWMRFPQAMAAGDASLARDWPVALLADALHKLCHDQMALCVGAPPRFFPPEQLRPGCQFARLAQWSRALAHTLRSVDHPYNAGLMQEALVGQASQALQPLISGRPHE
ncbi:MAG: DNA polymerase III subunit delta' [Rhodoferax sp.]